MQTLQVLICMLNLFKEGSILPLTTKVHLQLLELFGDLLGWLYVNSCLARKLNVQQKTSRNRVDFISLENTVAQGNNTHLHKSSIYSRNLSFLTLIEQNTKVFFEDLWVGFDKSFGARKFFFCCSRCVVVFAPLSGFLAASPGCSVEYSLWLSWQNLKKGNHLKPGSQTSLLFLNSECLSKYQVHHPPSPFGIVPSPII